MFGRSPLSQANAKPFHREPTPVTSKLQHDIIHLLRWLLPVHLTPAQRRPHPNHCTSFIPNQINKNMCPLCNYENNQYACFRKFADTWVWIVCKPLTLFGQLLKDSFSPKRLCGASSGSSSITSTSTLWALHTHTRTHTRTHPDPQWSMKEYRFFCSNNFICSGGPSDSERLNKLYKPPGKSVTEFTAGT